MAKTATTTTENKLPEETLNQLAKHVAERIEAEKSDYLQECEAILRSVAEENRDYTFDEKNRLWQTMRWDARKLAEERRRMTQVILNQNIAGTSQDRERLAAEATQSAADLSEHGEKLRQEIATAEANLRSLESAASKSAKRVEQSAESLNKLSRLLPEHVQVQVNVATRQAAEHYKNRLKFIEGELKFRSDIAAGPNENLTYMIWWEHLRRIDPAMGILDNGRVSVDDGKFAALKAKWNTERPGLEAEAVQLRSEYENAKVPIEAIKRVYWR